MVADVAAHQDERIGRGACKACQVANGVARCVEEVEGAIGEEVICAEAAYVEGIWGGGEGYFVDDSVPERRMMGKEGARRVGAEGEGGKRGG